MLASTKQHKKSITKIRFPQLPEDEQEATMDLAEAMIDPIWALRIPANLAHNKQVLPFTEIDGKVLVACLNDQNTLLARNLERTKNYRSNWKKRRLDR